MATRTRVLSRDPEKKKIILTHYDDVAQTMTIETRQDMTGIIEVAQAINHEHSDYRPFAKGDHHHVASVPLSIWLDLKKKGIANDSKAMLKWLSDPVNAMWRTMRGRLG